MRGGNDLEFMLDPKRWPYFPLLPVKRPSKIMGEWPEFATLFFGTSYLITHMSIDKLIENDRRAESEAAQWSVTNPQQLVADGWIVD